MEQTLVALPWQIQIALGAGYLAYMIAYAGIRDHHKGTDIAFRSIAFGLIATAVLFLAPLGRPAVMVGSAIIATLIGGVVWRYFGIDLTRKLLRSTNISWADDTPSAWTTIGPANSKHAVSQISVELDDGTWLNCIDAKKFEYSPFGPCVLGLNGDVALYVTHEVGPEGTEEEQLDVLNGEWGDRITFVPVRCIRRVSLRHVS